MKRGNETKPHIGIYGRCNAGKSTLLNLLIGESASIVSQHRGTTTDPVKRSLEILDFAPVVIIDTAGIDDDSPLGRQRTEKTLESLYTIDLAIIVYRDSWSDYETDLLEKIKKQGILTLLIHNKTDDSLSTAQNDTELNLNLIESSDSNRDTILHAIKHTLPEYSYITPSLFGERVSQGELVLLVCPIDSEAPSGRMILPQVQAIRDLLDHNAVAIVVQPQQIEQVLKLNLPVKMVVTDSQIIDAVRVLVPQSTPLTTFSILLAELKGDVALYTEGLKAVDQLKEGDRILILESCSHQTSCEDIGRVKIPRWIQHYCQKSFEFDFISKLSALPCDLSRYSLVIQCGGCMVTRSQLQGRIKRVAAAHVPITNYGMLIKKIKSAR